MRKIVTRGIVFSFLLCLQSFAGHSQETSQKTVLTMGKATDSVVKQEKRISPIINYLASRLKDVGIEEGKVVFAADNKTSTVINYLNSGRLDIALETPFSTLRYVDEIGAIPLLLISREGATEYNSYIFVRQDSGIERLEDLKGKILAFEDPASTSAYFLPKWSIKAEGLDLVEVHSLDAVVAEDAIGYIFAGSELNVSAWVFYGKVAAGALSSLEWISPDVNPETYREEFDIIYKSQKVPRMLVTVSKDLDKKLVARIKEELLNMAQTDEGREALKAYKIDEFLELPGGVDGVFESIRDLVEVSGEKVP